MANVRSLEDGCSYPHDELTTTFGLKTERAMKDWIAKLDIPYVAVNGTWWIAGEDIRKAMRQAARSHAEIREDRA